MEKDITMKTPREGENSVMLVVQWVIGKVRFSIEGRKEKQP
jgi:hypothetical protein